MNVEWFIARRLALHATPSFSRSLIRVAIAAICLSVAVMIVAGAIVHGFQQEVSEKIFGFWGHILIKRYQEDALYGEEPISVHQPFASEISKLSGIKHIQWSATKPGIIRTDNDLEGIILRGIGPNYRTDFLEKCLQEGQLFAAGDSLAEQSILISKSTAMRLRLKVGDPLVIFFVQEPLRARKFTVLGIYNTGLAEFDRMYAMVDLRVIQKLNNWNEDQIGGYEIFVNDIAQMDALTQLLNEHYVGVQLEARSIRDMNPNLFDWLDLQNVNERVIIILMLLVAVINMITVLLILILERTQMIGILKSLGASDWSIRKIFLYHALYIILVGMTLGNVLGLGVVWWQHLDPFITLNEESYYVSVAPVRLDVPYLIAVNVGTVLVCILTLLIPSQMVSRIAPVKVLRFQ